MSGRKHLCHSCKKAKEQRCRCPFNGPYGGRYDDGYQVIECREHEPLS